MILETFFATPIWFEDLNIDNYYLLKYCYDKMEEDPEGAQKSNKGGWQSKDIINFDELKEFEIKIKECLFSCFEDMGYVTPSEIILDNAWININRKGDRNEIHTHPVSVFSGVYYVKSNDKSGNIRFNRNYSDSFIVNMVDTKESKPLNWSEVFYTPIPGRLLIFPGHIPHMVEENESDDDRISIAFNMKFIY
jgi:uncharacterized protein (TIGR02466 family)